MPETNIEIILAALQELIEVVAKLRSPVGGCPWDLAQTSQTLIPYCIEETYELVAAIESGKPEAIVEELGDVLLQVILHAQIAQDQGQFTLKEVSQGITEKLIRRHPHVFANVEVENIAQVRQNWEEIKASEKGENFNQQSLSQKLARYAYTLPPILASSKISQKAAEAGFEWENVEGVWDKFTEELREFKTALNTLDRSHQEAELGDILFTLVNLARWYELDPSRALRGTNQRVVQRLELMETMSTRPLTEYSLTELDLLWEQAKIYLAQKNDSTGTENSTFTSNP